MNDDIQTYKDKIFKIEDKQLVPTQLESTADYNHLYLELNHFIRRSIRKNSPDFYKRIEDLQMLILMEKAMNQDLETMGEAAFLKKWGMCKHDLVFSRLKWREGYYDRQKRNEQQFSD